LAHEVEVGLRRGRETDFDFFETDFDELLEEAQLALHAHGFDQRLVAVAQVSTHPDGWVSNPLAGPGPFGKISVESDEGAVFICWIGDHGAPVCKLEWLLQCEPGHAQAYDCTRSGRHQAAELPQE